MRMTLNQCLAGMVGLLLVSSAIAQTNTTPVFQFAIFYNDLLEFTWCAPMTVNGPTHANGDIYVGSIRPVVFNSPVSTTGSISSPAWFGHQVSDYTNTGTFNAGQATIPSPLNLPIGTNNTPDALREIVNRPPAGEDPNSPIGQQRYYNKAKVILLVSNSTVTVTLRNSPSDPAPASVTANYYPTNSSPTNYLQVTTNFPFLAITSTFIDQRENKLVKATDVDMSRLKQWLVTNVLVNAKFPNAAGVYDASNAPNILYAADNRTNTPVQPTAIRLKNGLIIPTNMVTIAGNNQPSGFTVATPNPLYVWGHYNCPNAAHLGTTNTSSTYPASVVSDALTILSPNWTDAHSNDSFSTGVRKAVSTTVNAAILTGVVSSTGPGATQYSGGVQNLPRLLEDWGNGSASVVLTFNTSFVNLFNSVSATNQFRAPGIYYYAPTRQFSFDRNFLDPTRLPPGAPLLGATTPCITTPPQNQTVIAGQTAVFNVSATGYMPLSYQWQFNGSNIPNATNSTFTLTNASATNDGFYSVNVTNAFGGPIGGSALLTVLYPPSVSGQPVSQAALSGSNAIFSVSATGTAPLSFQWHFNGTNIVDGTDATLLLANVTADQAGSYSVTVTNVAGLVTSTPAILSIYDTAAAVLAVPPSFIGDQFQFSITGVPSFNYAIEASTNLADWMPLATNTSPFTFVDGDATNFPARYYRSVYVP